MKSPRNAEDWASASASACDCFSCISCLQNLEWGPILHGGKCCWRSTARHCLQKTLTNAVHLREVALTERHLLLACLDCWSITFKCFQFGLCRFTPLAIPNDLGRSQLIAKALCPCRDESSMMHRLKPTHCLQPGNQPRKKLRTLLFGKLSDVDCRTSQSQYHNSRAH